MADAALVASSDDIGKELASLREEHQKLARSKTRVAIFTLSTYFLLSMTFSRAVAKINSAEAHAIISEIISLRKTTGEEPGFPPFLALSYRSQVVSARDTEAEAALTPQAKEAARRRQRALEATLAQKEKEWFTFEAVILGSHLELDLHSWIIATPFILFASGSYFFILLKKRQQVTRLGMHFVQQATLGSPSSIDRLYFQPVGRRYAPPYTRYPADLEPLAYAVALLALTTNLAFRLSSIAGSEFNEWLVWIGLFLVTLGIYAFGYSCVISILLERQVDSLLHICNPGLAARVWTRSKKWSRAFLKPLRRRPRISVSMGSVLVLLSLPLAMTVHSCGEARTGYDLMLGRSDAHWFTVPEGFLVEAPPWLPSDLLGKLLYRISITLAIGSLLVVVADRRLPGLLSNSKLVKTCLLISGLTTLFVTASLGFIIVSFWLVVSETATILVWFVSGLLWCRYNLSDDAAVAERWPTVRAFLLILFVPLIVINTLALVECAIDGRTNGVMAFCTGNYLTTLGYLELSERLLVRPATADRPLSPP